MGQERIYFLEKNPFGSRKAIHDHALRVFPTLTPPNLSQLREVAAREQRQRWKETTRREPTDSHFTVILAVHNDHEFLPSALGTLLHADLPSSVHANFVIATNNCTDNGASINEINNFMTSLGEVRRRSLDELSQPFTDSGLSRTFSHVQIADSNISFFHFDTETPGRVNAFEVANTIALNFGDPIVLCLDANKFPQPEAIQKMIGAAYQELYALNDPAGIVTGKFNGEDLGVEENKGLFPANIAPAILQVRGPIMAWDPKWMSENGGILKTLREDSGIELFVLHNGRRIAVVDTATWGYTPVTTESRIEHLIRYYIGSLQIKDRYPELTSLLQEKTFYMKPWDEVIQILTSWAKSRGPEIEKELPHIIKTWQFILEEGNRRYKEAPSEASWEPAL